MTDAAPAEEWTLVEVAPEAVHEADAAEAPMLFVHTPDGRTFRRRPPA